MGCLFEVAEIPARRAEVVPAAERTPGRLDAGTITPPIRGGVDAKKSGRSSMVRRRGSAGNGTVKQLPCHI
jgi:hypothetical protein